jgi:hypothetical protein
MLCLERTGRVADWYVVVLVLDGKRLITVISSIHSNGSGKYAAALWISTLVATSFLVSAAVLL